MNRTTQIFRLTVVFAALLAAYGPVQAAEDDEITQLTKPDSSVSLGAGNWSRDRPHEGMFDGMRESGTYGLLDADILKRNDATGTWYTLTGRNLGLDSRELKGEYLRQGDLGLSLEYSQIPRDNPFTINTGLRGIGTTSQTVSGAGANAFPFTDVTLGTKRDQTQLGVYKNLLPGLDFNISFKNEEKNGTRHWGRGSASEFAVEPIDSTTRQLEMTLSYAGEQLQLSGGYYGSLYDNAHNSVSIFTNGVPPSAASPTFLSLPLDNKAHQLFLDGGYNFGAATRGTFKVSYTRATMDENLGISDTLRGAGVPVFAGAPSNLDGEINTTLVQLGLTSRPIKALSLVANLRYHDAQDDTPVARFIQTNPACAAGQCINNTPFSFQTVTGKLEGTYRLPAGYSLTGGVEQRNQDRTVPVGTLNAAGLDPERVVAFRAELEERTYRLELRRSLSETLNGSLAYLISDRTGSSYVSAAAGAATALADLINPIHIADRDRKKVRLALDWAPLESLSFQFGYEDARDKYAHDAARPHGLVDGSARLYSVDGNYVVNDNWNVTVWYSHDRTKAFQLGTRAATGAGGTGGLTDKDSRLQDIGNSVGVGLHGSATAKLRLGADAQWTRTNSEYHQTLLTPGTTSGLRALPDIKNTLTRVGLFGEYALRKNSDVRLDLVHERWQTDDWTWQFAGGTPFTYGTTTDGTTVNANPKQNSTFVGVRYIYRFL